MRIRGAKTELEDAGLEIDGMVSSTSELRDEIKSLTGGFDIMIDDNTFKSTYDIILGISKVYDKLSDTSQANMLEMLAGKRQGNSLAAALGNAEDLVNVLETSQKSAGSALREQEAYTEGIQYSIDRLQTSFQELSTTTLDSSTVKTFVDLANSAVNATTAVGGLIPVVGALSIGFGAYKLLLPILVQEMSALAVAEGFAESTTMSMIVKQHGLNGAFVLGSVAVKSFISSMLPIIGISAVIGGLVILYDHLNTSLKEQQEISQTLQSEYDSLQTELSNINTELENTAKRIDELNDKDNLTFVEQQELENLKQTNTYLESQNRLLEKQSDIKQRELADSIAQEFNKDLNKNGEFRSLNKTTGSWNSAGLYEDVSTEISEADYLNEVIDAYNKLSKIDKSVISDEDQKKLEEYAKTLSEAGVKYGDYADRYKIDDSVSQSWRDMVELIDKTLNPTEYNQTKFDELFNSDSFADAKKEIEDLAKVRKLTPDVISSNEKYKELLAATGMTAEQVVEHIKAITLETKNSSNASENAEQNMLSLSKALSTMSESSQLISSVKDEIKELGYISTNSLQNIADKYPELESAIAKYNAGLASTEDVLNELSKVYETDYENYRNAVISKIGESNKFYNSFVETLPQWLKDLANSYGIDFNNYKNLNESKLALDKEFASKRALLLNAQNFNSNIDDTYGLFGFDSLTNGTNDKLVNQLEKETKEIGKIIDSVDTSLDVSLNLKGYTPSGKDKEKDKTDEHLDAFNKELQELQHRREMDIIDESVYYNELEALNIEYFKNRKKYQEQYWQYEEEVYKGQNQLAEDAIKDGFDKVNDSISEYDKTMSEIDHYSSLVDEGSVEQLALLKSGYTVASDKAKELNTEISKLNEQYSKGEIPQDLYNEQLENLTDQLFDASSAMLKYTNSIKDYYDNVLDKAKTSYEDEIDKLENAYQDTLDLLDEQLNKRKEIIDAQKEELRVAQQKRQYEKEIAEQTDNISDIEARIAEVNKAALSGDRNAQAEKEKLEEELHEAKTKLDDIQYENQIDSAEKALDESYTEYEKMMQNQKNIAKSNLDFEMSQTKSIYDEKVRMIDSLYEGERLLIEQSASMTVEEFKKAYETISQLASNNGLTLSSNFTDAFASNNSISSILSNANGKGLGTSDLNKYVMNKGYGVLSYQNMVDLANALGLSGFTVDKVKSEKEQKKILEALKDAGFSTGGEVIAKPNRLIRLLTGGDDALAAVSDGEQIFTKKGSNTLESLLNTVAPKLDSLFKFNTPTVSNLVTNNSSPITLSISVIGDPNPKVVGQIKSTGNDLLNQLSNIIRQK
jgi:Skp family chaperone for outer membrane proteins